VRETAKEKVSHFISNALIFRGSDRLVGERTRIVNRMKGTLARLGIRNFSSAAQARSGGGKHFVPGGFRDELVEGLADNRGQGATLCRRLDLGIPRVMCVLDPAIRIAAGHPFARCPGVETVPVGTHQNRSDNDSHVSILQDDAL
jgi:hypothetical protein